MNDDENLDLLDLDDDASLDTLPDAAPFASPRPKKPWLLLGVTLGVIVLVTVVVIRMIGSDSSSTIEIDLDAPAVVTLDTSVPGPQPGPVAVPDTSVVPGPAPKNPPKPVPAETVTPKPAPTPAPAPDASKPTPGMPVRVVEPRRDNVTFNPDKPAAKPAPRPESKKPAAAPKKPAPKPQVAPKNAWYVQFGSYSTRGAAENAERQIRRAHSGLFGDQQFVILAAVLNNGTTTYRLRMVFPDSASANGFCRNAKSDGLDCYVAK
ncbi:hypothetical protein HDR63_00635 [bacterium]|nr:hypothetical protein [bacterium]